jgi:hypothetical protein
MEVSLFLVDSSSMSKAIVHLYKRYSCMSLSTQKILQHARMAEMGVIPRDPVKESVALELDMINIL